MKINHVMKYGYMGVEYYCIHNASKAWPLHVKSDKCNELSEVHNT